MYKGNMPRFMRRFMKRLVIEDVLAGRKVIIGSSMTDPGGIRRATDRHGRPDPRLKDIEWRIIRPTNSSNRGEHADTE